MSILVGAGVLFGFVALAVDGGSTLLQRRKMQNGVDAASLGVAQLLASNNVWNQGGVLYIVQNGTVTNRIDELLASNRGNTTGQAIYEAGLDYGRYVVATSTYTFTRVATYDRSSCAVGLPGCWNYVAGQSSSGYVPNWVDAVRVTASVNNPTTFARVLGITTIPVSAVAAAALQEDPNYRPDGPTWPMTARYTPSTYGLCDPVTFYTSTHAAQFEGLVSLAGAQGKRQGQNYPVSDTHTQLLTQHDGHTDFGGYTRWRLTDATRTLFPQNLYPGHRYNYDPGNPSISACAGASTPDSQQRWSATGSCSGYGLPGQALGHGRECCRGANDVSDIDVPNWIYWDFTATGRISVTSTQQWIGGRWESVWLDDHEIYDDWRSATYPPNDTLQGDWLETYLGTNRIGTTPSLDVVAPVRDYIVRNPTPNDSLASLYGPHVDKVMYLYDQGEVWEEIPSPPGCTLTCTYTYEWKPASGREPDRVHIAGSAMFRFYRDLASPTWGINPNWSFVLHPLCGGGTRSVSETAVLAIPVGEIVMSRPLTIRPHGLNNYVGYIDPG